VTFFKFFASAVQRSFLTNVGSTLKCSCTSRTKVIVQNYVLLDVKIPVFSGSWSEQELELQRNARW